ncbi:indolepyruvate ferredoxin oxidoreductase alpha subunit [Methanococcus voltae PS]|uniref:Indolepyruvate oxidoreductase subunit IorA n=3 Tax=Methanococcus voltae TaxID=2188 RepID=Q6SI59_METVO|nr:thiamine pyrophosphate-dependent enzyme [Methanococcus voltae]AAR21228.1 indolepyruvate oxidoreductase I alpha subunit [Methanococcus voltae PS]MCS3922404.1 indolepyruvate ferredoxin oxidoreductase alpha subunit [Methanococcus voltae PS]
MKKTLKEQKFLMGNEAIALGAIHSNLSVATGYAGTPSTEVMETIIKEVNRMDKISDDTTIYVEWSTNEKVALENAIGASYSGANTIVTMKQVGLNVASDPLMSLTYLGTNGALVIVVTDDPTPHSSQTEQDTRYYGSFANVPVFDPCDAQEAYDLTKYAYEISRKYKTPVILRSTTRLSHGYNDVLIDKVMDNELIERLKTEKSNIGFIKDPNWAIMPKLVSKNHPILEEKQLKIAEDFSNSNFNSITVFNNDNNDNKKNKKNLGIITSGVSYYYTLEALNILKEDKKDKEFQNFLDNYNVEILKISMPYPFPESKVLDFIKNNKKDILVTIEELDPVLEDNTLKLIGKYNNNNNNNNNLNNIKFYGKYNLFPKCGEYNVDIVKTLLYKIIKEDNRLECNNKDNMDNKHNNNTSSKIKDEENTKKEITLPVRLPTLCAGCMHRIAFYAFKKVAREFKKQNIETIFSGDIGCYTLGATPPLSATDTCLCMGAGISLATGLSRVNSNTKNIAFIGDSTFFHSGIPAVVNAVYNEADVTIVVLDNETTAMTGHQPHPGTGQKARGNAKIIDIEKVLKSCNVENVQTIDISKFANIEQEDIFKGILKKCKNAMDYEGVSAIIFKGDCVTKKKIKTTKSQKTDAQNLKVVVDENLCNSCKLCINEIGCPALRYDSLNNRIELLDSCTNCGLCINICPKGALSKKL